MTNDTGLGIPRDELRRLDFLIGEGTGKGTLYPPDHDPILFSGHLNIAREACERFVRMEFYGVLPDYGIESIHALITFCKKINAYRMWNFATSQEDALVMTGNFEGDSLVLVSEPTEMIWGLQRMRSRFTPIDEGGIQYFAELWTIDGYVPYCEVNYFFRPANVY